MKKFFVLTLITSAIGFSSCGNNQNDNHEGHDMNSMKKDSPMVATPAENSVVKSVSVQYSDVSPEAMKTFKAINGHYLHVKNALVQGNSAEAAEGAKAISEAAKKIDKSLLSAEQKTAYDQNEKEIIEAADIIAKNNGQLETQRTGFATLSEGVYKMVKKFGAGQPMYHQHCPMAKNNQGAMWMSEIQEIKNPYFGDKMLTCGSVEEVIK